MYIYSSKAGIQPELALDFDIHIASSNVYYSCLLYMNSINASASLPLESGEFERDDELVTSEPSRPASKYPAALVTRPISSSLKAAALAFVSSVCPNWSLVTSNVNRHWHCRLLFPLIAYPDTFSVVSSASRSSYLSGQLLNSPCSMSLSCTWDDNSLKLSTAFVCRDLAVPPSNQYPPPFCVYSSLHFI